MHVVNDHTTFGCFGHFSDFECDAGSVPAEREQTGHLLAVMAHSLLNSVAAIKIASLVLRDRDGLDDQQVDTVVDVINVQADHLYEMVKDLVRTGDPALMVTLADLDRQAAAQRH